MNKHLLLTCTYFHWNQTSVLKYLLDCLLNKKNEQLIRKQFHLVSSSETLEICKFSLRPSHMSQFRAINVDTLTWKHHPLSQAFPPLTGNFCHSERKWSAEEQTVQLQNKMQTHCEIKSKTNQMHLSNLTKASIKLAHLDWRTINHAPRLPLPRYILSKPYKYKVNRILVTDYKAIWCMSTQGLQLLTHAWKPSGSDEAQDSKEWICNFQYSLIIGQLPPSPSI